MSEIKSIYEEIESQINIYLEDKIYPSALLINGEWGSGKSFFISQFKEKRKDCIYVSLNGETNVENVFIKIISEKYKKEKTEEKLNKDEEKKHNKITEFIKKNIFKKIKKFLLNNFRKIFKIKVKDEKFEASIIKIVTDSILGKLSINLNYKNLIDTIDLSDIEDIIIFDDFERCLINLNELLGFINKFIENKNNIIIIANESQINNEKIEEYKNIKEKFISNTINFELPKEKILKEIIIGNIKDEYLKKQLLSKINIFSNILNINLRCFLKFISKINKINISLKILNNKNILSFNYIYILNKLIEGCFILTFEIDKIDFNKKETNNNKLIFRDIYEIEKVFNNVSFYLGTNKFENLEFAYMNSNFITLFKFLKDFINENKFNEKDFEYIIFYYNKFINENDLHYGLIAKIGLSLNEFETITYLNQIKEHLIKNDYNYEIYPFILKVIINTIYDILKDYYDIYYNIYNIMKKNLLNNDNNSYHVIGYNTFLNYSYYEEYLAEGKKTYIETLKEFNKILNYKYKKQNNEKIIKILEEYSWGEYLFEEYYMESETDILNVLNLLAGLNSNINIFIDKIKKSEPIQIFKLFNVISNIINKIDFKNKYINSNIKQINKLFKRIYLELIKINKEEVNDKYSFYYIELIKENLAKISNNNKYFKIKRGPNINKHKYTYNF